MSIAKDYFSRITKTPKKWELVWWWIFRCIMIFGILDSLFGFTQYGGNALQVKQMCANQIGRAHV